MGRRGVKCVHAIDADGGFGKDSVGAVVGGLAGPPAQLDASRARRRSFARAGPGYRAVAASGQLLAGSRADERRLDGIIDFG